LTRIVRKLIEESRTKDSVRACTLHVKTQKVR